ncbi:MAG: L-rhamnose mutarotase [Kordiimonadaceae bacterium]|jgi:L-rhamnose mutarotase|nr:L-rhamnose mutarotase [Kordiimonadaceae bacterium]MBT6032516.1 L-rhamnose mutarotase [Kordiimonadaceae bacterium]
MDKEIVAFKMKLLPGKTAEYKTRHDQIWPDLSDLLRKAGISYYSIFLDDETNILFGTYTATSDNTIEDLPNHPIMQKWWDHMSDIMETKPSNQPVSEPLKSMFYMK